MFSSHFPPAEDVLADLGEEVVQAVARCIEQTREDYADYRAQFPQFAADASERGIANWIHDHLWAHLRRALEGVDGVKLKDNGVTREIRVGAQFLVRVKRHDTTDRVRSYPTRRALKFWAQSATFEGFEDIHLSFGYRWDREERRIGSAIISLHEGLGEKPVWAVQLAEGDEQAATPFTWAPVGPDLPQLDLSEAVAKDDEEEQTS